MRDLGPGPAIAVALAAVAVALLPAAAAGQAALGVSPSRVQVERVAPGAAVELPEYTVANNSEQVKRVTVEVADHSAEGRELPPAEWFSLEPAELLVDPGDEGTVQVTVHVPEDAAEGAYQVWFRFHGAPDGAAGIFTAGAVNVPLTFDVREPPLFTVQRLLWAAAGAAGAATLGALAWTLRRDRGGPRPAGALET